MENQTRTIEPESQASTRASAVYEQLRDDVLTGILEPGSWLRLKDLMETYEIGNSPLREALSRLSSTGIVKWEENRGFHVPTASRDGLMELMRTRCWLEEIALRRSIVGGDDKWEENLVVAFHWLNQASQDNDYENNTQSADWGLRHDGFHLALICACDSETLVTYCVQLQERTFRYSRLAELEKYCDRDELAEHRKLQDATLQRNADLAVSLLHEHFTKTCEILLASDRFRSE